MSGKKTDITEEKAVRPATKKRTSSVPKTAAGKATSTKSSVKGKAEKTVSEKKISTTKTKKQPSKKSAPKSASDKPKDTAAEKITPQEKSEKQPETTSKTPQVMRLVEQKTDMVNPTILAGKSSIPRKLRGIEPLTRIMKREAEGILDPDEEAVTYNVTALVINDHAAEILRRFNACDCNICIEELSRLTADIVPARFAKLHKTAVERNAPEVEELKKPLKHKVTSQMIRLVMQNKKRSYHDI